PDMFQRRPKRIAKIFLERIDVNYQSEDDRPINKKENNLSYTFRVYVRVVMFVYVNEVPEKYISDEIHLCNMILMTGSSYCYLAGKSNIEKLKAGVDPTDCLGWVIVNGGEKHMNTNERLALEKIFVNYSNKEGFECR